jgi:hypothetical protein
VTAKLSRKFYEKLGDEIADELVGWFNQVDATYRADLREMNELNFARFDAKLEQRAAELRGELRSGLATLETRLVRWMFGFWTLSMLTLVGTLIALVRFIAPH